LGSEWALPTFSSTDGHIRELLKVKVARSENMKGYRASQFSHNCSGNLISALILELEYPVQGTTKNLDKGNPHDVFLDQEYDAIMDDVLLDLEYDAITDAMDKDSLTSSSHSRFTSVENLESLEFYNFDHDLADTTSTFKADDESLVLCTGKYILV